MIFTPAIDQERRSAPRVAMSTPVVIRGKEWVMLGRSLDLSESGMALSLHREALVTLHHQVLVTFLLSGSSGWINIMGTVVRQGYAGGDLVLGVHFQRSSPSSQQLIETFVSHALWDERGISSTSAKI